MGVQVRTGYSAVFKCMALILALSLAFSGGKLAVLAASATGTASATVVSPANVATGLDASQLRIRLPGLNVWPGPDVATVPGQHVRLALEKAVQSRCGDDNSCCNLTSEGRLQGNPASSIFASPVQLANGLSCRLTVMYN